MHKMPVFGDFTGDTGLPALHWITEVERYWQFAMPGKGNEVTFTLPKLKGAAFAWFRSTLGLKYTPTGYGVPAQEFLHAFKERYITPDVSLHARARLASLSQGNLDIRTFNEKFVSASCDLQQIPGDDGISASTSIELYLKALKPTIRNRMAHACPHMMSQSLTYLQQLAVECDHTMTMLQGFSSGKDDKSNVFTAGVSAAKAARSTRRSDKAAKPKPATHKSSYVPKQDECPPGQPKWWWHQLPKHFRDRFHAGKLDPITAQDRAKYSGPDGQREAEQSLARQAERRAANASGRQPPGGRGQGNHKKSRHFGAATAQPWAPQPQPAPPMQWGPQPGYQPPYQPPVQPPYGPPPPYNYGGWSGSQGPPHGGSGHKN